MNKQGTYAKLRNLAAKIEEDFGLKIAIVHQQSGFQASGQRGKTYALLCCAFMMDEDRDECERRHSAMRKSLMFEYHEDYSLQFFYLDSPKVWQDGNPMRAARAECWGYLLMEKVVYGESRIEILRECARRELGEDIFDRWQIEHRRWRWRCSNTNRYLNKRIKRIYQTCKDLLNKREREHVKSFLKDALQAYHRGRRVFIGIDGSGRPLARIIGTYLNALGFPVVVDYLDPHGFKMRHQEVELFVSVLEAEKPELFRMLAKHSEQCLLIEDQIGYGGQSEFLFAVLKRIAKGSQAKMLAMSQWAEDNPPPSWYQNYQLIGIVPVAKGTDSVTAELAETVESVKFYQRLEAFALQVAAKTK